jgi:peptidoglycan glycosyltransferase
MNDRSQLQFRLRRLLLAFGAVFMAVALTLVYWGVIRSGGLAAREDNPRQVEAALRVERGQILDYEERVLAHTEIVGSRARRIYPMADSGPAVGYYSFRHGVAGAEEADDAHLQGLPEDSWSRFARELLNRPRHGRDVRLTLAADWQQTAAVLLEGQVGAALLLTLPDGAIRAMVSYPGYDPNQLDADFDQLVADERAPLLNRAAQGQYQPGLALQPFLLAAAVEQGLVNLAQPAVNPNEAVTVNGAAISCLPGAPPEMNWRETVVWGCPAPLTGLATIWGVEGITAVLDNFGLTTPPDLRLATAAPPAVPVVNPLYAVVGQDALTVSPLQLALAATALVNGGELSQPHLTAALQDVNGRWQPIPPRPSPGQPISASSAQLIYDSLPLYADNIREHTALALSGPEGGTHSWYLGFAPANAPRYLVVVVLEQSGDLDAARAIGRALLAR